MTDGGEKHWRLRRRHTDGKNFEDKRRKRPRKDNESDAGENGKPLVRSPLQN
jgi:hypothetical protein